MKNAAIEVGMPVMLSLGRRGSTRVTVVSAEAGLFTVERGGAKLAASARRLSPVPVTDRDGDLLGYEHELNPSAP